MLSPRKALLVILAFAVSAFASAAEFKPGEVIVKYKDGVARKRAVMNTLYADAGVKSVVRFKGIMTGMEQLILEDNVKVQDAIAALMKSDLVEFAEPNYILHAIKDFGKIPAARPRPADGGIPCIPGIDIPGCDPKACLIPGIPFPPGCDSGGGGDPGMPGDPGNPGDPGQNPPAPPATRPAPMEPPAEVNPPVADPELSKAYGLEKIHATDAWAITKGSKNFIVGVIDTGADYNHEDLAFNMWRNPNPTQNDVVGFDFVHNDGLPFDDNMHGTHTSGTIGAVGGNGKGVSGVNQRVSIMALKFLSGEGSGTTADAIKAIDYAITHGAKVLSNSWGGSGDDDNKSLYEAIERAKAKDVLFVAAAGNDGVDNDSSPQKSVPASFTNDNLISVAATDEKDGLAFFSNYGKTTTHVAAPGVNVYSTVPGNQYKIESGTSMACPHVAGAAALVWSKNPTWTYKQVKEVLMKTVDPLPELKDKTVSGGRINVLKALQTRE